MSRAVLILDAPAEREKAIRWIGNAPPGTRIEFKEAKRTHEQNAKMWAMLTEVAQQLPWHGLKLSPDDWKLIFLDALKQEMRLVPNIGGTGFINLGRSSSDLSKDEMSNLIELMLAFGAEHGVAFADHASPTAPANDQSRGLAEQADLQKMQTTASDDQGRPGLETPADGQGSDLLSEIDVIGWAGQLLRSLGGYAGRDVLMADFKEHAAELKAKSPGLHRELALACDARAKEIEADNG